MKKTFKIPEYVKPTKTALITSHPCEEQAAKIRNKAISEMHQRNIGNVAYYILKCKRGLSNALYEIGITSPGIIAGVLLLITTYAVRGIKDFLSFEFQFGLGVFGIASYGYLSPSIANAIRYQKTISDCESYLSNEVDQKTLQKIMKLEYDGLDELSKILSDKGIGASLIDTDPNILQRDILNYLKQHIQQQSRQQQGNQTNRDSSNFSLSFKGV